MVIHMFNPTTQEVEEEAGESLNTMCGDQD